MKTLDTWLWIVLLYSVQCTQCMVAQSQIRSGQWRHQIIVSSTQGYSAWWHRIPWIYVVHGGTVPHFSDPDGGGTYPYPKILKPRDIVHGWWHRVTCCQIRIVAAQILRSLKHRDIVHGGTESHIVRSGWWRYRSSDPQTQCSTTGKPTHLFRTKCVSLDSV